MGHRARKRDACERSIIDALKREGCAVQQLDAAGCPDLLVGWRGHTLLMECKDSHGSYKKHGKKNQSGLNARQERWFSEWMGALVFIVTSPQEAIGALVCHEKNIDDLMRKQLLP